MSDKITVKQVVECFEALGQIQGCPPPKLGMLIGRNKRKMKSDVDTYREAFAAKIFELGGERTPGGGARLPRPDTNASEAEMEAFKEKMVELDQYERGLREQPAEVELRTMNMAEIEKAAERGVQFPISMFEFCPFLIDEGG